MQIYHHKTFVILFFLTTNISSMQPNRSETIEKIKLKPYQAPSLFKEHLQPIYHPTENAIGLLSSNFPQKMSFNGIYLDALNIKFSSIKNISFSEYNNHIFLVAFTNDMHKDKGFLIAKYDFIHQKKHDMHYGNICGTGKLCDIKLFVKNKRELWYKLLILDKRTMKANTIENNSNFLLT